MTKKKAESELTSGSSADVYVASDYIVSGKPIATPQASGSLYVNNGINVGSNAQTLNITDGAINCLSFSVVNKGNASIEGNLSIGGSVNTGTSLGDGAAPSTVRCDNLSVTTSATLHGNSIDALPRGAVIMWYGNRESIPVGWLVCDGGPDIYGNALPNLSDRFVLGVNNNTAMGQIGGTNSLTLSVDQMPAHAHDITISDNNKSKHQHSRTYEQRKFHTGDGGYGLIATKVGSDPTTVLTTDNDGNHSHDASASTTGSSANITLPNPPYCGLYFIMKQ